MLADHVVRWTTTGLAPVVHFGGEIDLANAAECFAAVRAELGEAPTAVIDLTAVTFIDSTGLREILRLEQICHLRVVAPPGGPRPVLESSGLDTVLNLFETVAAAQPRPS